MNWSDTWVAKKDPIATAASFERMKILGRDWPFLFTILVLLLFFLPQERWTYQWQNITVYWCLLAGGSRKQTIEDWYWYFADRRCSIIDNDGLRMTFLVGWRKVRGGDFLLGFLLESWRNFFRYYSLSLPLLLIKVWKFPRTKDTSRETTRPPWISDYSATTRGGALPAAGPCR